MGLSSPEPAYQCWRTIDVKCHETPSITLNFWSPEITKCIWNPSLNLLKASFPTGSARKKKKSCSSLIYKKWSNKGKTFTGSSRGCTCLPILVTCHVFRQNLILFNSQSYRVLNTQALKQISHFQYNYISTQSFTCLVDSVTSSRSLSTAVCKRWQIFSIISSFSHANSGFAKTLSHKYWLNSDPSSVTGDSWLCSVRVSSSSSSTENKQAI